MTGWTDYFHIAQDRVEASGSETAERLNAEADAMVEAAEHLRRRATNLPTIQACTSGITLTAIKGAVVAVAS